ncbi:MAG: NitT/TauT family transport system ATP-binding protein [Solirubrobacterales bacterium]|jgi:NitT/TauT family transport system ATP-binding protein|nr:NitT/TauT family transport system ATP-binding protein [Solirubrobacterales bacterium]
MLTRLREGTPDAAVDGRTARAGAETLDAVGGAPVEVSGVAHSFGELRAIERIDLEAEPGEVVGIVGPSGCGKTTLLELVAGLRPPDSGSISVDGHDGAGERLERCAYMPQRDLLLPWLSAVDNAALALRIARVPRAAARARAGEHFERLGLAGFEGSRPDELSGGMRQRVAFLRTLMAGRPVLLLDEPFASLDAITRAEMQTWLAGVLGPDRHTVLMVTHDVEEALYLSDRVLVLSSRPASVADRIEIGNPRAPDRPAAVTSPEFAALKERALRSLAEGAR